MYELERRIYVTKEILLHEYSYYYGNKKDEKVEFVYLNVKTDKESVKVFTYKKSLELARQRRADGRYKNYEFIIRELSQ